VELMADVTPIMVDSTVYDQGVETLRVWANQALLRGDWRFAAQLTSERHALEEDRTRIRNLEREAARRKR
jgi:hypothetical protein